MPIQEFERRCIAFCKGCIDLAHVRPPFQFPWIIDHVSYQCESKETYKRWLEVLSPQYAGHFDTSRQSRETRSVLLLAPSLVVYGHDVRVLTLSVSESSHYREGFYCLSILPKIEYIERNRKEGTEERYVQYGLGGRMTELPKDVLLEKGGTCYRVKTSACSLLESIQSERKRHR